MSAIAKTQFQLLVELFLRQINLLFNYKNSPEVIVSYSYYEIIFSGSVINYKLVSNLDKLKENFYLDNNLIIGTFTSELVRFLIVLFAQAAVCINNSRPDQKLEQRVEKGRKELCKTVESLKAYPAELIWENELLRNTEQFALVEYQVGGSLPIDSPTYVLRSADRNLYEFLKQGEFCYVLSARQMGKSSLMVRMIHLLQQEGFSCGAIDMSRIGSENITLEQWYKGFTVELWRSFDLSQKVNLNNWWNERQELSPVQRLSQFIEEVLLVEVGKEDNSAQKKIVIFIDEIDSVLDLNFPVDDFFALIRSCYDQRLRNQEYQRLTFALFGVTTASELISTRQSGSLRAREKTVFNIGREIQLEAFKEDETQPLLAGLTNKTNNPQLLLTEVLAWTGGQPFLTQKLCQLICNSSDPIPINREVEWLENLVQTKVMDNWESQDEPEHLRTIRDRILHNEQAIAILQLYQRILHQGEIVVVDSSESIFDREN